MHHTSFAPLILLGLVACTDAPDAVGPATSGIYRLEIHSVVETCDPAGSTEPGTVGLFRTDTALNYIYPDADRQGRVSWRRDDTGADLRHEYELPLAGTCAQGRLHHLFAVGVETPDRVEASLDQTWSDVVHCPGDPIDEQLPAAACESQRVLTYELLVPCEAPCVVLVDGSAPRCSC